MICHTASDAGVSAMTEWQPVRGFEGIYEVSDQGDVKRVAYDPERYYGKLLKQQNNGKGGWQVMLQYAPEKLKSRKLVGRLVLEAFGRGWPATGNTGNTCVVHMNGDTKDNRLENLRWGTPAETRRNTGNGND